MAKSIEDLIVRLKAEGFENIDKLRGSFRELSRVTGFTETELGKLRKEVLSFDTGVGKTTQSIKGQVDALRALQGQAAINSNIYNKLGKDLKTLGGAYQEAATGAKKFTDAQLATQFVGAKTATFEPQIAALRRGLAELSVYERQYTAKLTEIQRRQQPFSAAVGRQNVIAAFEAYAQGPIGPGAKGTTPKLPELPDTTAALRQRLSELSKELDNVIRGEADWVRVSRELVQVNKELGRTIETPEIQAIRARIQANRDVRSGFRAFSYRAGQVETRSRAEADAAFVQSLAQYPRAIGPTEPSSLFKSIGNIANQQVTNQLERMGRSYSDVAGSIRQAAAASDGSLNSLRAQRAAWENLRNTLGDNKNALREVDRELRNVDKQIGKRSLGGGRLSGMQLAQGVGAAISGGIFGGPEGLIGGLGGLALGGVGGAFAGAAAGAQVGMFRQQLVDAGEYAAQIDRLNTALLGVVKTQGAYADAQQTIKLAQATLNMPILEATQGFTQLSASVLAAGGKVSDVSTVFRGVTDAIKATGGGADQVQAALLAMTQIFSKGKVSAEELQGQLGERLPGAVALFASATNRSLPQLQKDLQDGAVGLNDVMKFAAELSKTYGRQAAEMASSTADSTARMDASLKDLQYAFGTIVKPITASIQTVIAKLADMATAALRSLGIVKSSISELGAVGRGKDLSQRAGYAFTALGVGEQTYDEKKQAFKLAEQLARAATPQKSIIGVQQNITALQQAREVIRRINADDLDKKQLDLLLRYGSALDKRVDKEQNLLKILQAKVKATDFRQPGDTTNKDKQATDKAAKEAQAAAAAAEQQRLANTLLDQQLNAADKLFQHQTELDRQRYELQKHLDDLQAQNRALRETGAARDIVNNFQELQQKLRDIEDRRLEAQSAVALAIQAKNTAAIRASFADQGAAALGAGGMLKGLPSGIAGYITGDPRSAYYRADHGGANYHEHLSFVSRQAAEAAYKRLIASGIKVTEFKGYGRVGSHSEGSAHYSGLAFDVPGAQVGIGKERELTARVQSVLGFGSKRLPAGATAQQIRAIQTGGKATVEQLDVAAAQQAQKNLEYQVAQERAAIFEQFTLKSTAALREQNKTMRDSAELQQLRNRLTLEGVTPNLIDLEENLLRVRQQQNEAEATYSKLIATTKDPAELSALTRSLAEQNAGFAEQIRLFREGAAAKESFDNAMRTRQDSRIGLGLREGAQQYIQSIGTMREATAQLAQTGIKGVEDAIFSLVTTGTANFREFAASILRDTSRMIIQQLILRSVMQIIGAIGGGASAAANPLSNFNAASATYTSNALGAAYASNGIVPFAMGGTFQRGIAPYAMGGIVSRPTFFAYANGGVPGTGLMGEAGPEAIMPLRRLPSGKLGVESAGGGNTTVTVNVDATGSSVQGDNTQGAALGRVIAAAVQNELIKQRRPGGLLAATRPTI